MFTMTDETLIQPCFSIFRLKLFHAYHATVTVTKQMINFKLEAESHILFFFFFIRILSNADHYMKLGEFIVHLPGHLGRDLDFVEKSGIPLSSTQKQYPSWHWTLSKWPLASQDGTYWPRRRGFFWVAASIRVHNVSTNKQWKFTNQNH